MPDQGSRINPDLDIHVPPTVLDALQAQAVTRLSVLASHIRSVAKDPWTLEKYTGELPMLDEAVRIILDVFKDVYKRQGWLDDGTVADLPVRTMALTVMRQWESEIAAKWKADHPGVDGDVFDPALRLIIQRLEETCGLVQEFAQPDITPQRKRALRAELSLRRFL